MTAGNARPRASRRSAAARRPFRFCLQLRSALAYPGERVPGRQRAPRTGP